MGQSALAWRVRQGGTGPVPPPLTPLLQRVAAKYSSIVKILQN